MQGMEYHQGTHQSGYYYGVPSPAASSGPIFLPQQQYVNYPMLNNQNGFYQESPTWLPYASAYNNGYQQYSPSFYQPQRQQQFPRAPVLHTSPIYSPYSATQVLHGYAAPTTGTNGLYSPGYDPNNFTYFTYPPQPQYYYQSGNEYADSYEEDTTEYYDSATSTEDYQTSPSTNEQPLSAASRESHEPVGATKDMDLNCGNGQLVETEMIKSEPVVIEAKSAEVEVEKCQNTATEDSDGVDSEADELSAKLKKLLKMESNGNQGEKLKILLRKETTNRSSQVAGVNHHSKDRQKNNGHPAPKVSPKPAEVYCKFCKSNRETPQIFMSHVLKDENDQVVCPILMKHVCPICKKTGTEAHTVKYCPERSQPPEDITRRYRKVRNSVGRWCILKY